MATCREQIEKGYWWWRWKNNENNDKPWKEDGKSCKWLKKQMNRFIRRKNKEIQNDDIGYKTNKKPVKGWEY